jgi:hypothetical protein
MNLPTHRIHDAASGYGFLVLPLGRRWLAWFDAHGFRRTWWKGFHNCTAQNSLKQR